MFAIGITVTAAPAPKPAAVRPGRETALVREPLERRADAGAVHAARADAGDRPPRCTDATRLVACASMIQPSAAQIEPPITTGRGPNLSTSQPSTGTSQVSVTMKMVNAV